MDPDDDTRDISGTSGRAIAPTGVHGCCCEQDHLTDREVEVLVEIAAGHENARVASRLSISRVTVAHHIANMLRRTGAMNRTELVAWGFSVGVLRPGAWPPAATVRRCVGQRAV